MAAIVVALVFQVAWVITRAVLEYEGLTVTNPRVVALSAACLAASYVTIVAASGGLARRLGGTRRVGAWVAVFGALAFVAGIALYEALLRASHQYPDAMTWAIELRKHGWSIADAVVILGLAMAAGPRGLWLAPPTIGLALLNAQPGLTKASWSAEVLLVLLVAKAVLLAFIAAAAENNAAPREPELKRALAALRRCESCAWLCAVVWPIGAIAWFVSPTMSVALTSAAISMAVATIFASATWSMARAAIPACPRWPWYASAMFSMWELARTVRSWSMTLTRHWDNLAATPLKEIHWSADIPGLLSALCALGALAVLAQRTNSGEARRASVAAATFSVLAFSVHCALPGQTVARVVCYLIANLAAVHAYRVARSAIDGHVPRARVV